MLHTSVKCQFQAIDQAAQIHCRRAVAIHSRIGAPDQFVLSKTVVPGEGVQINRGITTVQGAEVNGFAGNKVAAKLVVDLRNQIKSMLGKGIETLLQSGTRRHVSQVQGTLEKIVVQEALFSLEVKSLLPRLSSAM